MAGANWGIGIGAFADGLSRGMGLRKQIDERNEERQIKKLTKQGMAEAEAARQKSIDGAITTVGDVPVLNTDGTEAQPAAPAAGAPAAAPAAGDKINEPSQAKVAGIAAEQGITPQDDKAAAPAASAPAAAGIEAPKKKSAFKVGDREFGSMEEARKAAEANARPIMEFFMRDAAPKIRDAYIAQGKIEQAETFGKWIEDSNTKTGMRYWAKAVSAAQMGDYDAAARHLVGAYNTPGYFDDGYQAGKAEIIKGEDGKAAGFRVTIKGKDGKEHTQEFKGVDDMLSVGIGMLSPQARFDAIYKESLEAKKAKLQEAGEQAKEARKEAAEQRKIKFQAETQARLDKYNSYLRRAEESHRANVRGKAGSGDYRPSKSDEDLAADVYHDLKDDYNFKKMTPDEKKAAIADEVRAIRESISGGDDGVPLLDFGD